MRSGKKYCSHWHQKPWTFAEALRVLYNNVLARLPERVEKCVSGRHLSKRTKPLSWCWRKDIFKWSRRFNKVVNSAFRCGTKTVYNFVFYRIQSNLHFKPCEPSLSERKVCGSQKGTLSSVCASVSHYHNLTYSITFHGTIVFDVPAKTRKSGK